MSWKTGFGGCKLPEPDKTTGTRPRGYPMHSFLTFGIGVAARFVSLLAEQFAQWLFQEVAEGADEVAHSFSQLWEFVQSFVRSLAGNFCRRRRRFDEFEEYQPGYY